MVDTKAKRQSAVSIGKTPYGVSLDGSIDQADRQAIAFSYTGILAGESALWTVQNPASTSWSTQAESSDIWTTQTPSSDTWTPQ